MLLTEQKIREIIHSIILKEMSYIPSNTVDAEGRQIGFQMIPGIDAKPGSKYINPNPRNKAKSFLNAPDKYEKALSYRLAAYPGCEIKFLMAPSNFDFVAFHLDRAAQDPNSVFNELNNALYRYFDITGVEEKVLNELSEELPDNTETNNFLTTIKRYADSVQTDQQGLIIYFGGHWSSPINAAANLPPTPFILFHQILDETHDFPIYHLTSILENFVENGPIEFSKRSKFYFLEGTNFKNTPIQDAREAALDLVIMAIGWLNPDNGTIMKDNATNPGLAGSNKPQDIIKRCLAPNYKNDIITIDYLLSESLHKYLIEAVNNFWSIFKGRVILTWSISS